MKTRIFFLFVLLSFIFLNNSKIKAQCTNSTDYGSVIAPTTGATAITDCQYAGEYATIFTVISGTTYVSASSSAFDYFTIHSGTYNGPVVAFGHTPLAWTANTSETYYQHCNSNASCGTQNACRTTTIAFLAACTNSLNYGGAIAPLSGSVDLTLCQFAGDYATITSVVFGTTYTSSSSNATDYITIRRDTYDGAIVAAGTTPLTWTAPTSGTYYQHCNTGSACGTDPNCRTTSLAFVSPPPRTCESCTPADTTLGIIGTTVYGYNISGNLGNGGKWTASFTGQAGKVYHFDLCPDAPGAGTNNLDIDIKITDASCNILTGADGSYSAPQYVPNDFQWTCPANGTYYVILAPYNSYASHNCMGTAADNFTMEYYKEPALPVVCPVNVTLYENEPDCGAEYVDATNGGCNSIPEVYTQLTGCNDVVCAKSGTYTIAGTDNRDTDWYRLVLNGNTTVNMKVVADFPLSIIVADNTSGCTGLAVIASTTALAGDTAYLTTTFGPGTLIYWVGPSVYSGIACGSNYIMYCNTVAINAPSTPVIADNPACISTQLNAMTPPVGETYYWLGDSCGVSTANSASSPYPVDASGTYYVRAINNAVGCWSSCTSVGVTINQLPADAGTITGNSSVCAGTSDIAYSVPVISGATSYIWTYTGTGATINGTGNSVNITFANDAISGTLTVTGNNLCGNGTVSSGFTITVNPLPMAAGTIAGPTSLCAGDNSVAYSVPLISNATSYIWSYSGIGATINGTGNGITINFAGNATNGNLSVQGNNSCGNGTATSGYAITINTVPAAAGTIIGNSPICAGTNGVACNVPVISGAASYNWLYSGTDATIIGTGYGVTINFGINATSGNLTVQGNNTCGNGNISAVYPITVNPLPDTASIITGTGTVCAGTNNVAYGIPVISDAASYIWSYTGTGASIIGNGNNITINFASNATSGNLTVQGNNTCGGGINSPMFVVTVNPLPDSSADILGTNIVCAGTNGIVYSVPLINNATTYIWSYSGTGATTNGTGNAITIDFAPNVTAGTLTVQGSNSCGTGAVSNAFGIQVNVSPTAAGNISGTTPVCAGNNGIDYNVPLINNATTYIWSYTGTGATINGTGNTISIDFAGNATSGILTVQGNNICGSGTISSGYSITINPLPDAAGTITGTSPVCVNVSAIPYSVPAISNATTYVWTYSGTGAGINGSGNAVTVDFSLTATSGNLRVHGNNACGNGTSANFSITVNPCAGIEENKGGVSLQIIPNPNTGIFGIEFNSDIKTTYHIRITDAIGQILIEDNNTIIVGHNHIDIDMAAFATGTYYLNLFNNENFLVKTILIRH